MIKKFSIRSLLAIYLSFAISHIPEVAASVGKQAEKMITTQQVVEQMSRAQAEAKINDQLDRIEIKKELLRYGLSAEDIKMKLSSLSDAELSQYAKQIEKAQYAGGVTEILLIVVLVLLILYLAKKV